MVIHQGDIFWIDLGQPAGSEPGYRRPCVVIQNDVFNGSRISTVLVCILTTNTERAKSPGNVLLRAGEGSLSRSSVVNVSQIETADKAQLDEYIGSLSPGRIREVIAGIHLLVDPL